MSIIEQIVDIVNGSGGPNDDSIPIYGDNKAPNGGWVIGPDGKQLLLQNSEVSGIQYITVNPDVITPEENQGNKFITWKANGEPNYVRLWIYNPETGEGEDYNGHPMWAEYSHLRLSGEQPPEPPIPGEESTFVINWAKHTITLKPS